MIICQCSAVRAVTIEQHIREGASSVRDVVKRCGAGRYCPPCRSEIAAMIAESGPTEAS